jgi:triosephosphate isomerase (TIM)
MKPVIVINLKTYKNGKQVLKLAKIIEKVDKNIIIGVSPVDISETCQKTKLKIYSQHVDPFEQGRNTGFIIAESVKASGALGVFLNHSEHKLDFDVLEKTIKRCNEIKLKTLVFAGILEEAKKIKNLKPDFVVYEPPELVAGNISVSTAKPDLIKNIADSLKSDFLVGAGIKTNNDLKIAIKLGASGIALSSAITTAKNPEKALRELLGK